MLNISVLVMNSFNVNLIVKVNGCVSIASYFIVVLLFYVHGKHLRSCRDGQLT